MSKVIDLSQPLSDFDRQYLRDRGQLPVDLEKSTPEPTWKGSGQLHKEYGSMSIDELRADAQARELVMTGDRYTLIARLQLQDEKDDNG